MRASSVRLSSLERGTWVVVLTAAASMLAVAPANAYIDAGSTSLIFSALVAFLAAAGMTLRLTWRRVVDTFRRTPDDTGPGAADSDVP